MWQGKNIFDVEQAFHLFVLGFPRSQVSRESACNAGDPGSIPGSGRCPGEENGNPLQYSCLENLMDGGVWWATVHGVARVRHVLASKPATSKLFTHSNACQTENLLVFCLLFRFNSLVKYHSSDSYGN